MTPAYETISLVLRRELKSMKPQLSGAYEDNDHFMDVLGLDSLDLAEFVARIELNYRLEVDDMDWKSLDSIQSSAEYLLNRLHAESCV